jgi:hypothetical protein
MGHAKRNRSKMDTRTEAAKWEMHRKTLSHAKRNKGTLGHAERIRTVGHAMGNRNA